MDESVVRIKEDGTRVIPATTPDGEVKNGGLIQLYILKTNMSSPNFISQSKDLDDFNRQLTYTFSKETRQKIGAIRMKYKTPIYNSCLNFHGLYICSEKTKQFIEVSLKKADVELREVSPGLHADAVFIPLDFQQIFKGNLYAQIADSINYQVYSGLFERMEGMLKRTEEGKALPERSRAALVRMVDNLKSINVTDNDQINDKLAEFKEKIEKGEIKELRDSLKNELDANRTRWSAIEL